MQAIYAIGDIEGNNELFLKDELAKYSEVIVATEDGSVGTKGNVIDAIKENNIKA